MHMPEADDSQIYRELMRFKPDDLTANAWAVKAGVSRTVWADMRRHGNPSRRTLEKLLTAAGSSLAEFEALRVGADPSLAPTLGQRVGEGATRHWQSPPLQPLPLVYSSFGGERGEGEKRTEVLEIRRGEHVGLVPRPASLATDSEAYAITVAVNSMWPRFRHGRRLAVSPQSPLATGDDVLVLLRAGEDGQSVAMLKELVNRTRRTIELRQFNPEAVLRLDPAEVEAIHKVVGELI